VLAGFGVLLIRPYAHGFNIVTHLLPGRIVLATGLVLTITPLTALNLSAVEPVHSGIAAAIQNAVGRLSALIAVACVGLIAAGTLSDASYARLLQVGAVLFFIGAVISGVTITNPPIPEEPVPGEIAAALSRGRSAGTQSGRPDSSLGRAGPGTSTED
jgi:hypothetical protein